MDLASIHIAGKLALAAINPPRCEKAIEAWKGSELRRHGGHQFRMIINAFLSGIGFAWR